MQHCLFQRAIFSSADALFTAKFIRLLHLIGTLNFSSLSVYDKVSYTRRHSQGMQM